MIAYLEGKMYRHGEDYVVVKVGGIGYKVYMPASFQERLTPGDEVEIHTYNYVREDAITLYGFATLDELEIFERMLGVSRIGPKVALAVLGTMQVEDFKLAVINGDVNSLTEVKGIGKKTAKRLILELQEKVEITEMTGTAGGREVGSDNKVNEAVQGLVNLGYTKTQAQKAVSKILGDNKDLSVEEAIKESLNYLSQ
jgi:Holliday junction DNA helicase RuvA